MNRCDRIKARQVANAAKKGEDNPYDNPVGLASGSNKPMNKLQQLQAERKTVVMPVVGVSRASGDLKHYQTSMIVDLSKISNQRTLKDKAAVKQSVLPTYLPFVDAYIENSDNYPNTVAVQVMIWLLDVGEIEHGLNLALLLVKQNQKMPSKFKSDMPTFLCDNIYDWANDRLKADEGASPYLDTFVATLDSDEWDVHPLLYSKNYVMLAKHKVREEDYQSALDLCMKAEEKVTAEKAGVKGLKADIEKHLAERD